MPLKMCQSSANLTVMPGLVHTTVRHDSCFMLPSPLRWHNHELRGDDAQLA